LKTEFVYSALPTCARKLADLFNNIAVKVKKSWNIPPRCAYIARG
jgi:hypothetical protein